MMTAQAASGRTRLVRLRAHRRRLLALAGAVVVAIVGVIVYSEATAPNPFLPSRSMMIGTWQSASGAVITLRRSH
jgi:hypothetical protein